MNHMRFADCITIWVYIYRNGPKQAGLITASDQTLWAVHSRPIMLYICIKFCESTSNSRVDATMVANVDGRTDGRKTRFLFRAMPEAGATKR